MVVEYREVGPGDVGLFARLAPDVFDEAVRPDRLAAYLAEPSHHMIVAMADGEIVGQATAVIHRHPDKATELYIDELGVTPALRRQGIGRALFDALCDLGAREGCVEAWLGTEADNVAANRVYASRGVEPEVFVMYEFDL